MILRLTYLLKGYKTLASKGISRIVFCTEDSNAYELEKKEYWEAKAIMLEAMMRVFAIDLKEFGMIT